MPTEILNQNRLSNLAGVFTFGLLIRSVGMFAGLMVLHVLVWRLLKVRKQILWLFVIFLGVPTLSLLGGLVRGSAPIDWTLWYLLVFTLSSCYILFFPAVQVESPTLVMIRYLDIKNSSGGLTRDEIMAKMCSDQPVQDRIKDLQNNGLIGSSEGAQRLNGGGRLVAAFFYCYRRAMKLPMGGG